ncbi:GWxTD domain-containing protein [bacterium]|nr:GWxTD domain-containing protein [bacterium]
MRKIIPLIIIITAFNACISAPQFHMDYAAFRGGDGYSMLQIYLTIQRSSLKFQEDAGAFQAAFNYNIEISGDDSLLINLSNQKTDCVQDLQEIKSFQKIPEEVSFNIQPGSYTAVVSMTDALTGDKSKREMTMKIRGFDSDTCAISDIEFASRISKTKDEGGFIKNGLLVLPNAERVYSDDYITVYFYAEIYNLTVSEEPAVHTIVKYLLDQNHSVIKKLPDKTHDAKYSSLVEADMFSCATLPTGTYYLKLEVKDGCKGGSANLMKQFWVYRSEYAGIKPEAQKALPSAGGLAKSIEELNEVEAMRELKYIRYIADKREQKLIDKLKHESCKDFLVRFWTKKEAAGVTRENYLRKIEQANASFTNLFQEGCETDQGRVWVLYGKPDVIKGYYFETEALDNEIWYYYQLEGGVLFVFADILKFGNLKQVYSTKNGEYINAWWKNTFEKSINLWE